jgi:hypothetical protein
MADRELIAAILTAGMLPTMEISQRRAQGKGRSLTNAEADAIQRAVDHAFGLYRLLLSRQSRNQRGGSMVRRYQSCREPDDGIAHGAL